MKLNHTQLHAHVWEHLHSIELYACETTVEATINAALDYLSPIIQRAEVEACKAGALAALGMRVE